MSVYLTLHEWSILMYLIFLLMATIWGLFYGLGDKTASTQIGGLLLNVFMYVFLIWFIGKAYFYFRKTGGIKGDRS